MTKIMRSVFLSTLLTLGLSTAPVQALNTRSFISANGVDTNPCTRTAPCRTLQKAHDSTNPGGEINMLDPAGYGTVRITKAISIVNDGVGSAGILVPSGSFGIWIVAGASDAINLRGLIIEGAGLGQYGILFESGQSLTIENCLVRNLAGDGIRFVPTTTSSLAVANTFIAANMGTGSGVAIEPGGTGLNVKAVFSRVELHNNSHSGLYIDNHATSGGTISVVAVDSVASNNFTAGFNVQTAVGSAATSLLLLRSVSASNGTGVFAGGDSDATVRLAQSAITGNSDGFFRSGGAVMESYGDNYIDGNGSNVGALIGIAKQ